MKITDNQAQDFRYQVLKETGQEIDLEEAREALSRTLFLVERFAAWVAQEKAKGREFPLDGPPPAP